MLDNAVVFVLDDSNIFTYVVINVCLFFVVVVVNSHSIPVDAQLHEPLEAVDVVAVRLGELFDHVACMNLDGDERDHLGALHFRQIAADYLREFVQHVRLFVV